MPRNGGQTSFRGLTHLSPGGDARMVDVSAKPETARQAVARVRLRMLPATLRAIREGNAPKGDVLGVARTAGVPMLPVFAIRTGRRRCRVVFGPPIEVPRTDDRQADLTYAVGRVAVEVERAVRAAPHQWFVFRELWPKRDPSVAEVRADRAPQRGTAFDGDVDRVRR